MPAGQDISRIHPIEIQAQDSQLRPGDLRDSEAHYTSTSTGSSNSPTRARYYICCSLHIAIRRPRKSSETPVFLDWMFLSVVECTEQEPMPGAGTKELAGASPCRETSAGWITSPCRSDRCSFHSAAFRERLTGSGR